MAPRRTERVLPSDAPHFTTGCNVDATIEGAVAHGSLVPDGNVRMSGPVGQARQVGRVGSDFFTGWGPRRDKRESVHRLSSHLKVGSTPPSSFKAIEGRPRGTQ